VVVISSPEQYVPEDIFIDLGHVVGRNVFLKCEGFNFAGSIKLKPALAMVDAAEISGQLRPGRGLVESSSGNMGVALSLICAVRGYRFVCVTDVRCTQTSQDIMRAFGAEVQVVREPTPDGGFLGARLDRVRELCRREGHIWLNQYANEDNWLGHYRTTAPGVARAFPSLDVLFVGAGTTGTLMGCARYFREHRPQTRVVAIDTVGSVNFGGAPGPRHIPGLGTAVKPGILDVSLVSDVVHVDEIDAIAASRTLIRNGFLLGGSTGSVLAGTLAWLARNEVPPDAVIAAVSPDLGERYLNTVYCDEWVQETYGSRAAVRLERVLLPALGRAGSASGQQPVTAAT
jgi:cysteine synthase A